MTAKPSRNLGWLLAVSLTLNLLVAGSVAGFFLSGRHNEPQVSVDGNASSRGAGRRGEQSLMGPFLSVLDPKDRRAFLRSIRDSHRDAGFSRNSQKELRADMAEIIAADPFDPAAMEQVLARLRANLSERGRLSNARLIDMVSGMTPDQRLQVAERLTVRRKPRN